MEFKDRLKEIRKRENLTQEELSKKTGLAIGTIRQYEAGKRKPEFSALQKIAEALGISSVALLSESITEDRDKHQPSGISADIKKAPAPESGLDDLDIQLLELIKNLTRDQKRMLLAQLQTLKANLESK